MENNDLKEKIRKNIKEKIAISNVREEFEMKISKKRKIIYELSSVCAVFILAIGIFVGINTNNSLDNDDIKIGKIEELQGNKEEKLDVKLNINKLKIMSEAKLDGDVKTIKMEDIPERFKFINQINIPEDYKLKDSYNIFIRKDQNIKDYNLLHDYCFYYRKDEVNKIDIAFSEIEKPLRDYCIDSENVISKIDNIELVVSQYKEMYIVNFNIQNIYFDIETTGINENELVELLQSIISNTKNVSENKVIEDKDINVKEAPAEISTNKYQSFYAGKYIDNNGNNVVLLTKDTAENRKRICNNLGITESKTTFKKAKYTYEYLTDLQSKISEKMQNKEFPFVTSSSLMEDSNNIKVIVTSNNNEDINKIKELDTLGGTIDIQYMSNVIMTEDLLE